MGTVRRSRLSRFLEWFSEHKSSVIEETMLKQIREDAGLGCPPDPFTTNASETANFVLKNKVDYKHNQLLEFVDKLKQVVDDQEKEIEKAVLRGESTDLNLSTNILKYLRRSGTK